MQNSMYYTTSGLTSLPEYQGGGYLDQYGRQQYGFGKLVKKITKPISKVLDKIVPNEIKPALPFIAAAVPFMLGPQFSFLNTFQNPAFNQALSRAVVGAGTNALSQLSQEGAAERGLNPLSLGLSAATAGLSAPGLASQLGAQAAAGKELAAMGQTSFLDKVGQFGLESLAKTSDVLAKGVNSPILSTEFATAAVPGQLAAAGEQAYNAALDANKKYQDQLAAMGNLASTNRQQQIDYIRSAMQSAGFNDEEISNAITRSGFAMGGNVNENGLMSLKMGGMPVEMDLRAKGGFVPIGKKERADDVPARLSKNEFVFTAKAVRNAGGGDIRKGAKKMYQIMNQLEARA
jgi:alkylhydroperoxidase/carboxymuconolactone decarboxylase family protein YurZ